MDTAERNGPVAQPLQAPVNINEQPLDSYMNKYPGARIHSTKPSSPVRVSTPTFQIQEPSTAQIENGTPLASNRLVSAQKPLQSSASQFISPPSISSRGESTVPRKAVRNRPTIGDRQISIRTVSQVSDPESIGQAVTDPAMMSNSGPSSSRQTHVRGLSEPLGRPAIVVASEDNEHVRSTEGEENYNGESTEEPQQFEQLHYHHNWDEPEERPAPTMTHSRIESTGSDAYTASSGDGHGSASSGNRDHRHSRNLPLRPSSAVLGSNLHSRGRSLTPQDFGSDRSLSPAGGHGRNRSTGHSPDSRSTSYVDLLNISYSQQVAQQNHTLDNAKLRGSVGANASLLDTRKTLEMYRANVKKTNDPAVSYEFALFMIEAARQVAAGSVLGDSAPPTRDADAQRNAKEKAELLNEARQILQRLADRSYVFAQYYLADGYASGLFNKGKEDYERAFPLFVSAGKHGHAESGFRAALCYEFGWGCRRDYAKAVQFYRQSASKGHPGAAGRLGNACLSGEMGLGGRYREGITWLKRATESADYQHNSAPFELGLLHMEGHGDDIFKDEGYAAQLFTKAAELGHPEASLRMGEAYEHGLLTCPKDPALSIHFYTGAAQAGIPKAMMALCAWYMVGAEPLLEKDEAEAYEWAKRAAESGYAKAEYAVGYFTEMGLGCRRDPLEANVWYVRAADQGDERAKQRLQIIRTAETGDTQTSATLKPPKDGVKKKKSWWGRQG